MSAAQVTRDDHGDVAVLTLDVPGRRVNTVTDRTFAELGEHLARLVDDDAVVGAVLRSGKSDGFCAGADIARLPELRAAGDPHPMLRAAHAVVTGIASCRKPVVAAVHGPARGAGLELAIACHARVASAHDRTSFGLPEVRLGLLPGAGGTQYLPRLVALPSALEHLLTGRTTYVRRAGALGLVDDVVPANRLVRAAEARVRALAAGETAPRRQAPPAATELAEALGAARAIAAERGQGLWPAPARIIDVVEVGLREGLDAGLDAEADAFAELLHTPEAAAGIHLFLATEEARRRGGEAAGARKLFVLGGGTMGAGIAAVAVERRVPTRVREPEEAARVRVHGAVEAHLRDRYARRGADFAPLYRQRVHLLSTTSDLAGIGTADLVVEAVFEDAALKHEVLREAEARMRPDAVLASNTSAISIARLAEACARPRRFCGLHFFSPVPRMPLVEVIPHAGTSDDTLDRALGAARQLGKVPVVVADSPGFYTSRVFGRWLGEGIRLLLDGARIEQVDAAATTLGFPLGPLAAYDEVSLTLARSVAADQDLAAVTGRRLDAGVVGRVTGALVDAGHAGRRTGLGFYRYEDGRRASPAGEVYEIAGAPGHGQVDERDLRDRLLYAFVTEALACFDDGVLRSSADGDVAAVLGVGFPANLGGPFHYVERVGARRACARATALDEAHGGFAPGPLLAGLAEGASFADLPG